MKDFFKHLDATTVATFIAIAAAWLLYIFEHITMPWYLVFTMAPLFLQATILLHKSLDSNSAMLKHNLAILDALLISETENLKLHIENEELKDAAKK